MLARFSQLDLPRQPRAAEISLSITSGFLFAGLSLTDDALVLSRICVKVARFLAVFAIA